VSGHRPDGRSLDDRDAKVLIACAFTLQAFFLLSTMPWA
jgi:hypothetical protein